MKFISPDTHEELHISNDGKQLTNSKNSEAFLVEGNLINFLKSEDQFYEGAYLNRTRYTPKRENFFTVFPLWVINSGYVWQVRKSIPPNSTVLELGCASGVDYFGKRYNMLGLDLSLQSLKHLNGYKFGLRADATKIPLANASVDAIISSYFWEHIQPATKDKMIKEFRRVLKPDGKIVFLYDVETDNGLINTLKREDIALYKKLFLDGDEHLGYETPTVNRRRFEQHDFSVIKHFGMERTWIQANSVYEKFRRRKGASGFFSTLGYMLSQGKFLGYLHIFLVRLVDVSIGKLWPINKSRILMTVAQRR